MKCQNPKCGKFFVKLRTNSRFCSVACQNAEYNQRRNARQREQTASLRLKDKQATQEPAKPAKPKYKSPISDREQKALDAAVKAKFAIPPGEVKILTRKEIEEIYPTLTPPGEIRKVSALYGLCSVKQARWC